MDKRQIRVDSDVAYIKLTKGYVSAIDSNDLPLVCSFNWCALVVKRKNGGIYTVYAVRYAKQFGKSVAILMHRVIADAKSGMVVDHIDSNGLNNCRHNLRIASLGENQFNRRINSNNKSGIKGVYFDNAKQRWVAEIKVNGKTTRLGFFHDIGEAADACSKAREQMHGDFCRSE